MKSQNPSSSALSKFTSFSHVDRYPGNPILTAADFPPSHRIQHVFNSGVVKYQGRYLMMCRCENARLKPLFWIAESDDGIRFTLRAAPVVMPVDDPVFARHTSKTFYDPRITPLDGKFYITHAAHSEHECRLSLLETEDFEVFRWKGFISEPDNRNGVLFPAKFNGLYARLDRPNVGNGNSAIWISYSPDLIHWGQSEIVLEKNQIHWCYGKIGPGAVPIRTEHGWLNIFHGVRTQCAQHYVYQLGVCLHDLENPGRLIGFSRETILAPEEPYEILGQAPTVVFTCGAVLEDDGSLKLYYGGADRVMCLATTSVDRLVALCDPV